MSDADEESRRIATRSGRNNSGALSSSSSTAPTTLRVVASTVTEPTLNMPTTTAFFNNHLFGTAYKDILIAMDRVRQWRIDPTKHFQSEVHNLMILIKRANETNDNTMPDKNILAILCEEISKDPREALKITALNCQEQSVPLEEVLIPLLSSAGAAPMNRTVKIHSMESKTVTLICFRFQVNKCPFGDKMQI